MIRKLTMDEVEFRVECEPEHESIRGNCSAIDEATDRETERWVHDQLRSGNEWAWCCVWVVATWNGFEGDAYLGCCSYESEASFVAPGGYYDDMKAEALADLNQFLNGHAEKLEELTV